MTPGSASGPDGLSTRDFKRIPDSDLQDLYNAKLAWGRSSLDWQEARTILLPKTDNPESPSEFWPITITSVLTRGLHKLLAKRLNAIAPIDQLQRGFKAEDSMAGNLLTLKNILKAAKTRPSSAYIAFIDFRKAFDSVFHGAVLESAAQAGLDEEPVRYLASVYSSLRTRVMGEETTIRGGVAQGDPLSPALFNLTLQRALQAIPDEVGLTTEGGNIIHWMAFADGIVVMASLPAGLTLNQMPLSQGSRLRTGARYPEVRGDGNLKWRGERGMRIARSSTTWNKNYSGWGPGISKSASELSWGWAAPTREETCTGSFAG